MNFVKEIKYKLSLLQCPPWEFSTYYGTSYDDVITIKAQRPAKDVYTGEDTYFRTAIGITYQDLEYFTDIVHNLLRDAEIHELDERFIYDNKRLFNPHR